MIFRRVVWIAAYVLLWACGPTVEALPPSINNGDMSQGTDTPNGWADVYAAKGRLKAVRDVAEFAQGPASLRLETLGGPARGQAAQTIADAAGASFVVTGQAKAELTPGGFRQASVVLFIRDASGKTIDWIELANVTDADEWAAFRARVNVPADGVNTQLLLYLRGQGAAWLDEVQVYDPADAPPASPILTDFDQPADFTHGDWKMIKNVTDGRLPIAAAGGRGGVGLIARWDLAGREDHSPALRLRVEPGNEAKRLLLMLTDADGTQAVWSFPLADLSAGEWRTLWPADAAAITTPNQMKKPGEMPGLDLTRIKQVQLQGDWTRKPVAVSLDRIELVELTPQLQAARDAGAARQAKAEAARIERDKRQAEKWAKEREAFLADIPRDEESPRVVHVGPVAADILGITIDAGRIVAPPAVKYEPHPDDVLVRSEKTMLGWRPDGTIGQIPKQITVKRGKQRLGLLVQSTGMLLPNERIEGHALFTPTLEEVASYRISSADHRAYASPVQPTAVYRKSKPTNQTWPDRESAMRHTLYLKLPAPLQSGATYTIAFPGINTREPTFAYRHDPATTRSEAIHVSQVGFRPDDPYKAAFLSIWLGTGGGHTYPADEMRFKLIDEANGQTMYEGPITLRIAGEQAESIRGGKNHNQTDVYVLDFSGFTRPGRYQVVVPGIGCSPSFMIGGDVWTEAFKVSMEGFLTHRSGIALGEPFTAYQRPRTFHPDDGARVFRVDTTTIRGESAAVNAAFLQQLGDEMDPSILVPEPAGWGGYMDAGDWDRRSNHLIATHLQLDLLSLFPTFFQTLRLSLPSEEVDNRLPDLLDEVLFHLDFYRRLQLDHGGVRGGIESTAHPVMGEASWEESLLVGVFGPDALSSYRYAGAAAKAAAVLEPIDSAKARAYRDSALAAWRWAGDHIDASLAEAPPNKRQRVAHHLAAARLHAAVELYGLTGEQAFNTQIETAWIHTETAEVPPVLLQAALFAYARLPGASTDSARRDSAIRMITQLADTAMTFADGNAFGISNDVPSKPVMGYMGYYSTPNLGSPSLIYAHVLTGDPKYLAAAIRACNSAVGANPGNRTYTTGLGHTYPQAPLHIDSRVSRQKPPSGITVYGPSDPAEKFSFNTWMHQWFLQDVVPASTTWPTSEAYLDTYLWPAMNEYTITQTMGPTSFYFGYLAAREAIEAD